MNCLYIPVNVAEVTLEKQQTIGHKTQERQNFEEGHLEISRLDQHAFEEDQIIVWNEAKMLQTEMSCVYRKYKEMADVSCSKIS